jgi:hypothetical protein
MSFQIVQRCHAKVEKLFLYDETRNESTVSLGTMKITNIMETIE